MTRRERHIQLFNRIAVPYRWFLANQTRSYARAFEIGRDALPSPNGKSALDIGCGTGAFTKALQTEGWEVQGIDASREMLAKATETGLRCSMADILGDHDIPDKSFDLVSSAYVAHGMPLEDRIDFYNECKRISRDVVLFHDYTNDRNLLISIAEYLEGGDYFNFIRGLPQEFEAHFRNVRVVRVGAHAAWYICTP